VTDPLTDLAGLPSNCSLMAISNVWDLVFIAGTQRKYKCQHRLLMFMLNDSIHNIIAELLIFKLSEVSKLSETAGETQEATPKWRLSIPGRAQWVR
jgi:hypothetical protein